ncbi:hypothetical protein TRVL_03120 [Trypanosoma vivax]|uniref:Uncharacterized protein n=1 Tax=Trypanosoma vivax (strain Y486) TaxID=1055687 RepID=G0U4X7_TRYVY|nr:hypothetical protein TRVL_03120 [Trypanosoma vivax]CCC52492.1 conserved hypothetical protein [Trypanosoma vivax Y486]
MFSRRVYASAGVPRRVWASLHIQSSRQAQRILPSLAPVLPSAGPRLSDITLSAITGGVFGSGSSLEPLANNDCPLPAEVALIWHRSWPAAVSARVCLPLRTILWMSGGMARFVLIEKRKFVQL